jgi:uncharacterized membrane protein (DUF485 family)
MNKSWFLVLFFGMMIGFSIHGLAVQFMNNMIVWKIIVHSILFVGGIVLATVTLRRQRPSVHD